MLISSSNDRTVNGSRIVGSRMQQTGYDIFRIAFTLTSQLSWLVVKVD